MEEEWRQCWRGWSHYLGTLPKTEVKEIPPWVKPGNEKCYWWRGFDQWPTASQARLIFMGMHWGTVKNVEILHTHVCYLTGWLVPGPIQASRILLQHYSTTDWVAPILTRCTIPEHTPCLLSEIIHPKNDNITVQSYQQAM